MKPTTRKRRLDPDEIKPMPMDVFFAENEDLSKRPRYASDAPGAGEPGAPQLPPGIGPIRLDWFIPETR